MNKKENQLSIEKQKFFFQNKYVTYILGAFIWTLIIILITYLSQLSDIYFIISISVVIMLSLLYANEYRRAQKIFIRNQFTPGSNIHKFLKKTSIITLLISLILIIPMSLHLVLGAGSLIRTEDSWSYLWLFICVSGIHFVKFFFGKSNFSLLNGQVNRDTSQSISMIIGLLMNSALIAMILAMMMAIKIAFFGLGEGGSMTIDNFDLYAIEKQLEYNGNNHYVRLGINFYILGDAIKQTFQTIVIIALGEQLVIKYIVLIIGNILSMIPLIVPITFFVCGGIDFIELLKRKPSSKEVNIEPLQECQVEDQACYFCGKITTGKK